MKIFFHGADVRSFPSQRPSRLRFANELDLFALRPWYAPLYTSIGDYATLFERFSQLIPYSGQARLGGTANARTATTLIVLT